MGCGCGTTKNPDTVTGFKAAIATKTAYLSSIDQSLMPLTAAKTKRRIKALKAGLTRLRNKRRLVAA
jgi:hypothetical protein